MPQKSQFVYLKMALHPQGTNPSHCFCRAGFLSGSAKILAPSWQVLPADCKIDTSYKCNGLEKTAE